MSYFIRAAGYEDQDEDACKTRILTLVSAYRSYKDECEKTGNGGTSSGSNTKTAGKFPLPNKDEFVTGEGHTIGPENVSILAPALSVTSNKIYSLFYFQDQ